MILIDGIWYDETSNSDLIEIAEQYDEEFARALRDKFSYYESIDYYEN